MFPGAYNDHNRKVEESYPQNQVTFARCYAGWFQPPCLGDPRDLGETAREIKAENVSKVDRMRENEIMRETGKRRGERRAELGARSRRGKKRGK